MARYRKKPVEVDAWPVTDVVAAMDDDSVPFHDRFPEIAEESSGTWRWIGSQIIIPALEGDMTASRGDFIIRGVAGEFYPCKPDIFATTYEAVD